LKDWIRYDPTLRGRAIRNEIEKKVKHTKYLEICADIANRRKHSRLTRKQHRQKRASRKSGKVRADIKVDIRESSESSSVTIKWDYTVSARGRIDRPALDVARGAVDEWRALLTHHKLEP
jgi:hypothetical protein